MIYTVLAKQVGKHESSCKINVMCTKAQLKENDLSLCALSNGVTMQLPRHYPTCNSERQLSLNLYQYYICRLHLHHIIISKLVLEKITFTHKVETEWSPWYASVG